MLKKHIDGVPDERLRQNNEEVRRWVTLVVSAFVAGGVLIGGLGAFIAAMSRGGGVQ